MAVLVEQQCDCAQPLSCTHCKMLKMVNCMSWAFTTTLKTFLNGSSDKFDGVYFKLKYTLTVFPETSSL